LKEINIVVSVFCAFSVDDDGKDDTGSLACLADRSYTIFNFILLPCEKLFCFL
jgi:hypothetical protein